MRRFLGSLLVAVILLFASCLVFGQGLSTPAESDAEMLKKPLPEGVSQGWYATVQKDIAANEYHLSPPSDSSKGLYQAPNRAQGFRSLFTEKGVKLCPRDGKEEAWQWGLEVIVPSDLERRIKKESLIKPKIKTSENKIEFDRGWVKEWFVNSPEGLEHGFTIYKRDSVGAIHESPGTLNIDMKLTGGLHPKFAEDGQRIDFHDSNSVSVLSYSKMKVTDSTGQLLAAKFVGVPGGIRIEVDDANAVYPVTVDPIMTTPAWTAEGGQWDAYFGWSVSAAGDINGDGYSDVIVGARLYDNGEYNEGAAFVFHGSPSGLGSSAGWMADGGQESAEFGYAVSMAGDLNGDGFCDVIVGARFYDGSLPDEGRVFVYFGSGTGVTGAPVILEGSGQDYSYFGNSVSYAGDVNGDGYGDIVAGEPSYANGQTAEGRIYLFHGSASGIATSPSWVYESDLSIASLGTSVSTAGDVNGDGYADVVAGMVGYTNGETYEGRALVFHGSQSGLSLTPDWADEGDQAYAYFGISATTAGDVNGDGYSDVIVGAYYYDDGEADEGAAFVYHGGAAGLSPTPDWTGQCDQGSARFGESVSTAGDVNGDGYCDVIVGAPYYSNGETNEGRAFLYLGGASGIDVSPAWTKEGDQEYGIFGRSLCAAGDVNGDGYGDIVIGMPNYDEGEGREGAAFLFTGSPSGPAETAGWSAEGDKWDSRFGCSAASAGDINGDGFGDIVIGASNYDNGQLREGAAFIFMGSATGPAMTPSVILDSNQTDSGFGCSVASAGDVNGDGFSDVVVGAVNYDNGQSDEGAAFLYHGSASGLVTAPAWIGESDVPDSKYGISAASAGDVNGDGFSDVVVGASNYANGQYSEGAIFLYHGSASGLSATASGVIESGWAYSFFGRSVSSAGDVNGDGFSDVIVGQPSYGNGEAEEGAAYLFLGSATGLASTASWMEESDYPYAFFGQAVSSAGDVNGDGYSDVVVGARGYEANRGRAYLFEGGPGGLSNSPAWIGQGGSGGDMFGISAGCAGDVNGDGYSDIIVGATGYDNGQNDEGAVYLYLGSASGPAASPNWTAESGQSGSNYGTSASSAGDVNGDGYSDVIAGADCYDNGDTDEGAAFLYYGNGRQGVPLRLRQMRSDMSAPISPLGRAGDGLFKMALKGRNPFGRGDVKLEWQTAPLGGTFDTTLNPSIKDLYWTDSGSSGASISRFVTLPEVAGAYIWRVRTVFSMTTTPLQSHGPWLTIAANGARETDLRSASACIPPDEPCWIYLVTTDGTNHTINFQDPNQPDQRTGWNIRRSDDPSLTPKSSWPFVGTNVVDMDQITGNYQWTDSSGDVPPSGIWYYLVTTYNANCPAEGPFASN